MQGWLRRADETGGSRTPTSPLPRSPPLGPLPGLLPLTLQSPSVPPCPTPACSLEPWTLWRSGEEVSRGSSLPKTSRNSKGRMGFSLLILDTGREDGIKDRDQYRTSFCQGSGSCGSTGRDAGDRSRRQGWITVFCAFPCWQEPLLTRLLNRAGLSPSVRFD